MTPDQEKAIFDMRNRVFNDAREAEQIYEHCLDLADDEVFNKFIGPWIDGFKWGDREDLLQMNQPKAEAEDMLCWREMEKIIPLLRRVIEVSRHGKRITAQEADEYQAAADRMDDDAERCAAIRQSLLPARIKDYSDSLLLSLGPADLRNCEHQYNMLSEELDDLKHHRNAPPAARSPESEADGETPWAVLQLHLEGFFRENLAGWETVAFDKALDHLTDAYDRTFRLYRKLRRTLPAEGLPKDAELDWTPPSESRIRSSSDRQPLERLHPLLLAADRLRLNILLILKIVSPLENGRPAPASLSIETASAWLLQAADAYGRAAMILAGPLATAIKDCQALLAARASAGQPAESTLAQLLQQPDAWIARHAALWALLRAEFPVQSSCSSDGKTPSFFSVEDRNQLRGLQLALSTGLEALAGSYRASAPGSAAATTGLQAFLQQPPALSTLSAMAEDARKARDSLAALLKQPPALQPEPLQRFQETCRGLIRHLETLLLLAQKYAPRRQEPAREPEPAPLTPQRRAWLSPKPVHIVGLREPAPAMTPASAGTASQEKARPEKAAAAPRKETPSAKPANPALELLNAHKDSLMFRTRDQAAEFKAAMDELAEIRARARRMAKTCREALQSLNSGSRAAMKAPPLPPLDREPVFLSFKSADEPVPPPAGASPAALKTAFMNFLADREITPQALRRLELEPALVKKELKALCMTAARLEVRGCLPPGAIEPWRTLINDGWARADRLQALTARLKNCHLKEIVIEAAKRGGPQARRKS